MPDQENTIFEPLPEGPFQIIYADPPWSYRGQVQHGGAGKGYTSGADAFYPCVSVEDLCTLPVSELRDPNGTLLYLWCTGPILLDAIDLIDAWGFDFVQVGFVWDKERVNPGSYTMTQCEYVLIAKFHRIPQPRGARNVRQLIRLPRTEHSRKPEEAARRIEEMFPEQRKLELFARRQRSGWTVWGNETDRFETADDYPGEFDLDGAENE